MRRQPKQSRAVVTREVILTAAVQVLMRQGYARTTTNRVAECAGVSVGSLYQYFANKDEILAAVLQRFLAHLESDLLSQAPPVEFSLAEVIEFIVIQVLEPSPRGAELMFLLQQAAIPDFRRHVERLKGSLHAMLRDLALRHADFAEDDSDLDTRVAFVIDAAEGLFLYAAPRMSVASFAAELSRLTAGYLLAPSADSRTVNYT